MAGLEEAALRIALWVNMAALLLIVGAGIFFLAVWRRSTTPTRPLSVESTFIRRWRRTVVAAWGTAILSSVILLIRAEEPEVEAVRLGFVLLAGIAWLGLRRKEPFLNHPVDRPVTASISSDRDPVGRWSLVLVVVALLGLLLSVALTGHARESSVPLANVLVALAHVTGAAAWVGGLVMLVAVAFPALRERTAAERARLLAPVVARFSDVAFWSVLVVVASGAYTAWNGIRELEAVTGTTYGWVFVAKLNIFLPALALGAINKGWTKPRLMRAAQGLIPASSPVRLIRRLVLLEVVLVAAVLGLTAFLVALPPPSNPLASAIR